MRHTNKVYEIQPYKRTFIYNEKGFRSTSIVDESTWMIMVEERDNLIPNLILEHYHGNSKKAVRLNFLTYICSSCGEKLPNILNAAIDTAMAEKPGLYAAVEITDGRLRGMKKLAENWLLNENKNQKEPSLHHICNTTHPAYLYYGRGIPLSHLTLQPRPDCCKTCTVEIPIGIRMALLMTRSKLKL